jgi:hypothetical protein
MREAFAHPGGSKRRLAVRIERDPVIMFEDASEHSNRENKVVLAWRRPDGYRPLFHLCLGL